jgi:putative transposase
MVRYRRNFVPGRTYFFTATLLNRGSHLLVERIAALRTAFRTARKERPFAIDAVVVLPDHLHVIMTLPSGDADFSGRWRRIKAIFTHQVVAAGETILHNRKGEYALWRRRFWEHTIWDDGDFARHVDYIHFQPGEARPGLACTGLAALVISPLCPRWVAAAGLGRLRQGGWCRLRRAERVTRIALRSIRATIPLLATWAWPC